MTIPRITSKIFFIAGLAIMMATATTTANASDEAFESFKPSHEKSEKHHKYGKREKREKHQKRAKHKKRDKRDKHAKQAICDGLKGDEVTPGLYGLCNSFCAAQQECTASFDAATNTFILGAECKPSSQRLLDKYNKRKTAGDPDMPCLDVPEPTPTTQATCPCWGAGDLASIADGDLANSCTQTLGYDASIKGTDAASGSPDMAMVQTTPTSSMCMYVEQTPYYSQILPIGADLVPGCVASIQQECANRGL